MQSGPKSEIKEDVDLHPRRHELFLTVKEAKDPQNEELIFSDHLMGLVKVPLNKKESLKIITLNVLGPNAGASGLHEKSGWEEPLTNGPIEEKYAKSIKRYKRQVEGIVNGIKQHGVDVIALQEADPDLLGPILLKMLGKEDWEIIADDVGIITCYNKKKFKLQDTKLDTRIHRVRSLTLVDNNTNTVAEVHNIWGKYEPVPDMHEEYFKELLFNKGHTSVVVGDTNSRIAPVDDKSRNITTGVVPICFNLGNEVEDNTQVTDYPDGGFCCGKDGVIHQLELQTLEWKTANVFVDKRDPQKLKSYSAYRMVMCLDHSYQQRKVINNRTIFEYEDDLRAIFPEENLVIRMAADSINQKVIGINFPSDSPLLKYLKTQIVKNQLEEKEGFQIRRSRESGSYIIFAPIGKAHLLHNEIFGINFESVFKNRLQKKLIPKDLAIPKQSQLVNTELPSILRNLIEELNKNTNAKRDTDSLLFKFNIKNKNLSNMRNMIAEKLVVALTNLLLQFSEVKKDEKYLYLFDLETQALKLFNEAIEMNDYAFTLFHRKIDGKGSLDALLKNGINSINSYKPPSMRMT